MKYIKKDSVAKLNPINGSVTDTMNVEDKITNAPSLRVVNNLIGAPIDSVIAYDGDDIPEGYELVENEDFYTGDMTTPVGSIFKYDGDSVPEGFKEIEEGYDIYSTKETKIGEWIDGKAIYRKVIEITSGFNANMMINHNISNLDNIINYYGFIVRDSGDKRNFPSIYPSNMANHGASLYGYTATQLNVTLGTWFTTGTKKIAIIIEYTKTTN